MPHLNEQPERKERRMGVETALVILIVVAAVVLLIGAVR